MELDLLFSITVSQVGLVVKRPTSARDLRDVSLNPGSGRSPGGGYGSPLQYSCLEKTEKPGRLWSIGSQRVGRN